MIKIELEVTPSQLTAIAKLLDDERPVEAPPPQEFFDTLMEKVRATPNEDWIADPVDEGDGAPLAKGEDGGLVEWDGNIHSASKAINKDGTWKSRRGGPKTPIEDIPQFYESEGFDVKTVTNQTVEIPPAPPTPPTPPEPVPVPVPVPPSIFEDLEEDLKKLKAPESFVELLTVVNGAKGRGELTQDKIDEVCAQLGLENLAKLATQRDLIQEVAKLLGLI